MEKWRQTKYSRSMEVIKGSQNGRKAVIVGAGKTVSEYKKRIDQFIERNDAFTIGINNMGSIMIPDYHLWTNKKRWREFGKSVNNRSRLLVGPSISDEQVDSWGKKIFARINYLDEIGMPLSIKDGQIQGRFRTAGVLSIIVAHLMGANDIYIAGMDGYTLSPRSDLDESSQHCYGRGLSDGSTWEECVEKDEIVNSVLKDVRDFGINFCIITPTVFRDFYERNYL